MRKTDAVLVGNEDDEQWTLLYWAIWGQMLLLPPPCRICGPFVQPVLIQEEFFGILVGGAVGAGNPKLACIYLQVSYVVLSIIGVFVIVAWNVTEKVWVTFGSDPDISRKAVP